MFRIDLPIEFDLNHFAGKDVATILDVFQDLIDYRVFTAFLPYWIANGILMDLNHFNREDVAMSDVSIGLD